MPKLRKKTQEKRIKPELGGGFRDYGSGDAILRQRLLEKIHKTFEDFGFDPMETPAVERTEVLLGGEKESGKIIFNVRGSKEKKSDLSLRFDLTVPLARFLAVNPEIPKPFKRYQIGNVWRGESPQAGRYREFLQADLDIAGASSTDADAEIIAVIWKTFKNLGLSKFIIKINNRKVLNGLPQYAGFPEKKLPELLRLVDKKEKIGEEALKKELKKVFKEKVAAKIWEIIAISGDTKTRLIKARETLRGNAAAEEGINELIEIARNLNTAGVLPENWEIDYSVARGLGYYTGSVFETYLTDAKEFGSVASGGRYDFLTVPFTGQKLPTVGGSIGVDRLYAVFEKLNLLKKKQTSVKVLILNLLPELKKEYLELAQVMRAANINTSFYLGDDRAFQAQLAYAVKKEIPYVVILGENESKRSTVTVKNLVTREQKEIPKEKIVEYFKR
ncbi:MAG: Histidine-tRNA ligase [Parcubacteria group bacterium GW2011_GWA2_45_30]|nr:MAG: Histidine-tRNA ligase [Parcubacteria group bacterium GW2011_GWA2_45_30]